MIYYGYDNERKIIYCIDYFLCDQCTHVHGLAVLFIFCQLFCKNALMYKKFKFITLFSLSAYFIALVCDACIFNAILFKAMRSPEK